MPINLWQPGQSGNPTGRLRGSRNKLSEEDICALLRDFRKHGEKAIARVRRDQPGIYLKVLALLIPRQDKLEHTNTIKTMTDEELESAIAFLQEMMAAQAVGSAHLVEMKAEPAALPAPGGQSPEKLSSKRKLNRLMMEVDTAIGPQERKPRKRVPSPASRPLQPIRKDLVIRFRRQRLAREAIMAAKEISVKKYVVRLTGEERERLETLIRKGKSPARRVLKARIL